MNMKLTETARKILESYKSMIDGLALYLGTNCEIVLHSLEDMDRSIIKIINGEQHSGRTIGAPVTNLALTMLNKINEEPDCTSISYFTRNSKGEPTKSTTIAIRGERDRVIGLVCMNYYLNTPLIDFLQTFAYPEKEDTYVKEVFSDNKKDVIDREIQNVRQSVLNDTSVLPSLKNKRIIEILYNHGIFNLKNSVEHVAEALNLSSNTVYLHIRNLKK